MCPKLYFYICVISIALIISLQLLCRNPWTSKHGLLSDNTFGYTLKIGPDRVEADRRSLSSVENIIDALIFKS